jgi:hypothetical protein
MLIVTNKMQRNTIFFIVVKALHVSGVLPAHHQELKNCTCSVWYLLSLVAATALSRCCMYSFLGPDDGRGDCLKHAQLLQQ